MPKYCHNIDFAMNRRDFLGRFAPGPRRRRARRAAEPGSAAAPAPPRRPPRRTRSRASSTRRTSPPKAKRIIYLFMSRRAVAARPVRPQAAAERDERPGPARQRPRWASGSPGCRPTRRRCRWPARSSSSRSTASAARLVSELLPWTAKIADELCFVKSLHTEAINHDPAITFFQTGSPARRPAEHGGVAQLRPGQRQREPARVRRPDLARTASTSRSTPGSGATASCRASTRACSSAAARTRCSTSTTPTASQPRAAARCSTASPSCTRSSIEDLGDPEINARVAQYEMAYRMQTSVPEVMDVSKEPQETFELYGPEAQAARHVRRQLPARPPAGRARRAVHPALPPRLGPPRRPARRHPPAVQGRRPRLLRA